MKLALSLALLGLVALVASARTDIQRKEFKFTPGKVQVYEYRGRIVNGIPKLANQYSGLQVECNVALQAVNEQQVVMKLDNIRVGELNHNQKVDEHYERIDSEKFDGLYNQNKDLTDEYERELTKPIRFVYINGKVHDFEADVNEAEWSVNMKKSIVSLFQLDLTPSKIIKASSIRNLNGGRFENDVSVIVDPNTGERRVAQWSPEEVISQTAEMPLVYPVYEETYQGICETQYQVDSIENVDQQQQQQQSWSINNNNERDTTALNVTKTINFKNCLTDPSVSYDEHVMSGPGSSAKSVNSWQKAYLQQQRLAQYNAVPDKIRSKYSNAFTSTGASNNVASAQPVDRYSYLKYNITQQPETGFSVIEGVLAEGKIKYQADGDELVSISHQKMKLSYVASGSMENSFTGDLSKDFQQIPQTQVYTTIQCEMTQQKMKFYQDVMRQASQKLSLDRQQQSLSSSSQNNKRFSSQVVPPFANSASWYSLVVDDEDIRSLTPAQLSKNLLRLLDQLVENVRSEQVDSDSKKAGHRAVQIVHLVANLNKHELSQVYETIVSLLSSTTSNNEWSSSSTGSSSSSKDETSQKMKMMRKIFLDSLPLAGSKSSVQLIEELIANKRVSSWEAKELVESVPQNIRYPDKEIIDSFVRLSQSSFVRDHQTVKMSTSLAAAKMIANAYSRSKDLGFKSTVYEKKLPVHLRDDISSKIIADEADPRQQSGAQQDDLIDYLLISEQDIIKYVKIFKGMLEKARNYHDRVTYIETLAHMRVPQVLPVLQPYISGRISLNQCLNSKSYDDELTIGQHQRHQHWLFSHRQQQQQQQWSSSDSKESKDWSDKEGKDAEECNFLRTIAIYATAHIARSQPQEVLPLVLPVFDNTYEPYQIRIAAFTIATLSDIDEHTLERIATQMWREPSKQVASFVVGSIDTLANVTHPKMSKIAYAARKASESMPKQYLNTWRYSWLAGGDHYNNEVEQGLNWVAELVKSNVSSIPRGGYFLFGSSHGPAAQNYDNKMELGWNAKGLEQFMEEYLTDEEGSLLATIFQQVLASSEDIEKYYEDVRETLNQQQSDTQTKSWRFDQQKQSSSSSSSSPLKKRHQHKQSRFGRSVNGEESEKSFGNTKTAPSTSYTNNKQQRSHYPYYQRDGQSYSWESTEEEPKLALFAKLFDQTTYLALDKQQMMKLARDFDDYITEMGRELIMGRKMNYVKMLMPSSMWQMVPSQIGHPVFITHRKPIIVSIVIDGSIANKQSQQQQQQQHQNQQTVQIKPRLSSMTGSSQQTAATVQQQQQQSGLDSLVAYVHPKVICSNYRFMFTVDQAKKVAYGVQTEKSHQVSVPMTMSVAYSQPRQLVSFAVAPIFLTKGQDSSLAPNANQFWSVEVAKTFVGDLTIGQKPHPEENWLGDEKMIRSRTTDNIRSPSQISETSEPLRTFERALNQKWLGLDLVLKGATDEDEFDWTFDMEDKNQHSKSGPFAHWLHVVDELKNRPCKYQEVFGYLRADQAHKQPVYKFEVALEKPLRVNMIQKQQQYLSAMRQQQQQSSSIVDQQQLQQRSRDGAAAQPALQKHTAVIIDENSNSQQQDQKVCFSVKPVKKCPKGTQVLDTVVIDTPFTCLSTLEVPNIKRLIEEAQENVLHQMEEMRVTINRPFTHPRLCSVY